MTTAIAIDGPAGAGKSTIARRIAAELGYIYVDTGALYRAVGYFAISKGVSLTDETALMGLLLGAHIELRFIDTEQRVFLNDKDVTAKLRTESVSMASSAVAALPAVREFLLDLQRGIAAENNVVMNGRDIGTKILPGARIKLFLTATPEERARRRYEELTEKGVSADYDAVLADLKKRDYDDSHRESAPLRAADDAIRVDTTGQTFDESVEQILSIVKEHL